MPICPRCGPDPLIKNGHIHTGKPKFACKDCRRQFVENPVWKPISAETKVVHRGSSRNRWNLSNARLASWAIPAAASPHERMAMRVPVGRRRRNGLTHLVPVRKPSPLEGQRPQDRPPGLNQVQVGGVCGVKDELPARMSQRG